MPGASLPVIPFFEQLLIIKMNHISRLSSLLLLLCLTGATALADIVENLNRPGSTVTVEQPDALAERLRRVEAGETGEAAEEASSEEEREAVPVHRSKGKIVGYRVQVYADNNQRVAKGEARQRERAIGRRFPSMMTYVAYASPYWRLRVGDFRTQAEAEKAAVDIRHAFPGYAREVRVVRDRINAR